MGHYDRDYEHEDNERIQETKKRLKAWAKRNEKKLCQPVQGLTVGELFNALKALQDDLDGK